MVTSDLVDRLAAHRTLGAAPREELAWLAARGSLRQLNPGEVVARKGSAVEGMFALLSGRIVVFADKGGVPQKLVEWRVGDVTGALPYSRLVSPPGNTFAQEPTELFVLAREHFTELISTCQGVTTLLVHTMLDRARMFTSAELHDEKMISLGKLSAGLAHELNNPAAAIERSAALLDDRLEDVARASRTFGAHGLAGDQLAAIDQFREACARGRVEGVRSPLQQADHEEAIAEWVERHALDRSLAETLADTAATFESLDRLAGRVTGPALEAALRLASAECAVRTLAADIQEAATRISGLVVAIKGFTHMNQSTAAEPVDVLQGLRNTVAVLRAKARKKSAAVVVSAEPALPNARGFAGELNQIWSNLIDNALDAIPESGRVEITASRDPQGIAVSIIDNGTGIPAPVRARIFDPFFTTKPMGQGTGLGLDIVRRLVRHNDGEISVESRPGRTEFRVVLPAAEGAGAGAAT